MASRARRRAGVPPPPAWQHPALESDDPVLEAAASRAKELGEAHGWSSTTITCTIDGLAVLLDNRPADELITPMEIRERTSRHAPAPRITEVLSDLGLLADDNNHTMRRWIDRHTHDLPAGFAADVHAWLLWLLDGDARTRPRSHSTLRVYFGMVRPALERWATVRGHLREITRTDVAETLAPLRGWKRHNVLAALRSLFRFAKKRGLIFTDPTTRLKNPGADRTQLPMTDAEITTITRLAASPAQRLVVALAAIHAARPATIRCLLLDDLDLPNQRITLAGHTQRLGDLPLAALRSWLANRRAIWPHSPNPHVLISPRTAHGRGPVASTYLHTHLLGPGIRLDRIGRDRILHEALTAGPDPLHLALIFNLAHATASRYADIARELLDTRTEAPTET